MKFLHHPDLASIRNRRTVTLMRAEGIPTITLTVYALPPTFPDDAERELPSPRAPWKGEFARDKRGKIEQTKDGRPIRLYDDQDETFLAASRETSQLQSIKMVVDALDPTEVQFEARRNGPGDARTYYRAVQGELAAMGVSLGDLADLLKAVSEVSNISMDDLQAVRGDFFETGSPPSST